MQINDTLIDDTFAEAFPTPRLTAGPASPC
jgi:hypothetical protein